MMDVPLERTISLTDETSSIRIYDAIQQDLVIPGDSSKHQHFLNMPKYNIVVPNVDSFSNDFRKFSLSKIINLDLLKRMQEDGCLNWCHGVQQFVPLFTTTGGNSLMNAASLAMWGVNDRKLILRTVVYQVLAGDESDVFKTRWEQQQSNAIYENLMAVDITPEELQHDWKMTVQQASPRTDPETNSYARLEGIHIFVLANVLRRAIIVLESEWDRVSSLSGKGAAVGGVYLPLLCDSLDCVRSPLLLGSVAGTFTALVTTKGGHGDTNRRNLIPLTKSDGSPLPVHFLLGDERRQTDRLLREYLQCDRISHGNNVNILAAVVSKRDTESHVQQMFKTYFDALQHSYRQMIGERSGQIWPALIPTVPCCGNHKRCRTPGCENYTEKPEGLCFMCAQANTTLCVTPDCKFTGNPDYEGMCSTCYARYHIVQEPTMPVPSAPPPSHCRTNNCKNMADPNLYMWCIKCYLAALQKLEAEEFKNAIEKVHQEPMSVPNVGTPSNPDDNVQAIHPTFSRQVSLFCHSESCRNPLEGGDTYYCQECLAKIQNASMPGMKVCTYPGCSNILPSQNTSGLCKACVSSLEAAAASIAPREQHATNDTVKICSISGCSMPAVTYHGEFCMEHYRRSLSILRGQQLQQQMPDADEGTICMTEGCSFYGLPENNYLCSRCHAKALQELYDMEKIMAEQERAKREWFSRNARQADVNYEPQVPHQKVPSQKCDLVASTPGIHHGPQAPSTKPCVTQGCGRFALSASELCLECVQRQLHCRRPTSLQQWIGQ